MTIENRHTSSQRTFLATTALDEFWDKNQSILFLGSWCTKYSNQAIWKNLDCEILDSPLIDLDPDQVCREINKIYDSLFPELAQWLNKIHKTHHSIEYWDIVIGPFLFTHIQTIYDRYYRLKKAYLLYPELMTIGLAEESYITPLNTLEHYESTIFSDLINLQLMTQIISLAFNPPLIRKKFSLPISTKYRETQIKKEPFNIKHWVMTIFVWMMIKLRRSRVVVLLSPTMFEKKVLLKLMFSSAFKILPLFKKRSAQRECVALTDAVPNFSLRSDMRNISTLNDFSRIVVELLIVNTPLSFIENYKKECDISKKCFPYHAKIIFGVPGVGREMYKLWVASNRNKGTMQIGHQHGGGYGAMKSDSIEYFEHKFSDFYVSWGLQKKGTVIPAPSNYACSLIARREKEKTRKSDANDDILWVATEFTTYPSEIKQGCGANFYENLYHSWHPKVLTLLQPEVFSKIIMRLRPTHWTDHWRYLQDAFPALKIHKPENGSSFYEKIFSAKLLLFDNLNTTHLYGLALNIPSILFWDERVWTVRDSVKEYFDALRDAGIYHTTPESAASMINKIAMDPLPWWNSAAVQSARRKYCDYFVMDSKDWAKEWQKVLLTLLNKNPVRRST